MRHYTGLSDLNIDIQKNRAADLVDFWYDALRISVGIFSVFIFKRTYNLLLAQKPLPRRF